MKKCFLFVLLVALNLHAQSWQWGRRGGSNNNIGTSPFAEQVESIATDSQGNAYILSPVGVSGLDVDGHAKDAYSFIENPIATDYMIASFSCDGTYRWSKVIGGYAADHIVKIQIDAQDNLYAAGYFTPSYTGVNAIHIDSDYVMPQSDADTNSFKKVFFLLKFDRDGAFKWMVMPQPDDVGLASTASQGYSLSLQTDLAGNSWWLVYLTNGTFADGAYPVATSGFNILKYDTAGNFMGGFPLDMQFGGSGASQFKMVRNPDTGTLYFAGFAEAAFGDSATFGDQSVANQLYVAAFDTNGLFLWKKESTPNILGSSILDLSIDSDGSLYVTGSARPNMSFGGHTFLATGGAVFPFVMKLDPSGNVAWATNPSSTTASSSGYAITRGGLTGNYGGMTWDGTTLTAAGQGYDVFLARFNPSTGAIVGLDSLTDDDGSVDSGTAIAGDIHGNLYVGGSMGHFMYVNSPTPMVNEGPDTDFFVAKFGSDDCSLGTPESQKPGIKAWPNPVEKTLNFENLDGSYDYEIYNALGNEILHGSIDAGDAIDVERLSAGLYLLKLNNSDRQTVIRILHQ